MTVICTGIIPQHSYTYKYTGLILILIRNLVCMSLVLSDLPGPAQSREPGQAEPVSAGPGQANCDGPATALARLRPRLCKYF